MTARRRRSCLTVPGDDEQKLAKAAEIAADELILDLEDAVSDDRKERARQLVCSALRRRSWRTPTIAVRVNSARTPWHAADVDAVAAAGADVIVVPKVESPGELDGLPAPLEAQIETARGLVECERIASVPGLEALVLGPGDLAASLGVPELTIGSGGHVEFALMRVVVAARAFGLAAVDGPFVGLGDDEGLRSSALRSRALGYDGKWCIHPSQIASCNEIYSATDAELERARRILEVPGVGRLDGEMVDEATRRMAQAVLARARDPAPETE